MKTEFPHHPLTIAFAYNDCDKDVREDGGGYICLFQEKQLILVSPLCTPFFLSHWAFFLHLETNSAFLGMKKIENMHVSQLGPLKDVK